MKVVKLLLVLLVLLNYGCSEKEENSNHNSENDYTVYKERGYEYDNFAFYPQDEPSLEQGRNVANFMKWAKLITEIYPKISIYANPVAHITIEQLEEIAPFIDIWTPLHTMIFPEENWKLSTLQGNNFGIMIVQRMLKI